MSDGGIAGARDVALRRIDRADLARGFAAQEAIGAAMTQGLGWDGGFALLTSRCSYELVEKAVLAGYPMLVTISAATTLAVDRAKAAWLTFKTLARRVSYLAPC